MKDKTLRRQMPLFDPQLPNWTSLPSSTQQLVIDVLSQLLRDAIDNERELTTTTKTKQENDHVS